MKLTPMLVMMKQYRQKDIYVEDGGVKDDEGIDEEGIGRVQS